MRINLRKAQLLLLGGKGVFYGFELMFQNGFSLRARGRSGGAEPSSQSNDDAQRKFGGAKAISSDMFFSGDSNGGGRDANTSRFSNSTSISSAEYFGREEGEKCRDGNIKSGV